MIVGEPETLAEVLQATETDPEIEVVEVQGDRAAPSRLIVATNQDRALTLKAELAGRAVVDPNPLLDL